MNKKRGEKLLRTQKNVRKWKEKINAEAALLTYIYVEAEASFIVINAVFGEVCKTVNVERGHFA